MHGLFHIEINSENFSANVGEHQQSQHTSGSKIINT